MIKIEKLSHIIGTALLLEMARAYGLRSPSPIVAPGRKQWIFLSPKHVENSK